MIKTVLQTILFKAIKSRKINVKLGFGTFVNSNVAFEGNSKVGRLTIIRDAEIGFGTYVSDNCLLVDVKIGRFCSIGDRVKSIIGIHPVSNFVSTHPAFYSTSKQAGFTYVKSDLFNEHKRASSNFGSLIGNDVWIGSDVKIIQGVKIGDGAVVATGAIVTKDVKPYEIVAGCPAKHIKDRFEKDVIDKLLKIRWWETTPEDMSDLAPKMTDIDRFLEEHTGHNTMEKNQGE